MPDLQNLYATAGYGNQILSLERQRMINEWVRGSQQMRRSLIDVQRAVADGISNLNLDGKSKLTKKQISDVMKQVAVAMIPALEDAKKVLNHRIDIAIRRSVRAYNLMFGLNGLAQLNPSEIATLVDSVLKQLSAEFPAESGLTYEKRLDRAADRHYKQVRRIISRSSPDQIDVEDMMHDVYVGLRKIGPTGIQDGSLANKYQSILAAEEARVTTLVGLSAMAARDLEFAYWRLSPNHPWYGGGEICELHASSIFAGPMDDLIAANLQDVDTTGLYHIDGYPDFPHPWCRCYPEPLIARI